MVDLLQPSTGSHILRASGLGCGFWASAWGQGFRVFGPSTRCHEIVLQTHLLLHHPTNLRSLNCKPETIKAVSNMPEHQASHSSGSHELPPTGLWPDVQAFHEAPSETTKHVTVTTVKKLDAFLETPIISLMPQAREPLIKPV